MQTPIFIYAVMTGAVIVLAGGVVGLAASQVVYCDARAPGNNSGSSWSNAYVCLQDALKVAGPGVEVRVAQGIYKPDRRYEIRRDGNRVVASGKRTDSFVLPSGGTLKGGYAGYGAANPDHRDIAAFQTILSGDLAGNDIGLKDYDSHSIAAFVLDKSRTDNSLTVIMTGPAGGAPVVDGFTITGGHAGTQYPGHNRGDTASALIDMDGAGAFLSSGSPRFVRCTFRLNTTCAGEGGAAGGAGVLCMNASPTFVECDFRENFAFASAGTCIGGAMRNILANPVLTNCTFTGNVVSGVDGQYWGGAIANYNSSPTLTGCRFQANLAVRSRGGALFNSERSDPILIDCLFESNLADYGGAVYNNDFSSPTLTRCTFLANQASYGRGGAILTGSKCTSAVLECRFIGNIAAHEGGALCVGGQPVFANCLFLANGASHGAVVFAEQHASATFINCTLTANTASQNGGAIYGRQSNTRAVNCILWANLPQEVYLENASAEITYSNVQDAWAGEGNIHSDPRFLDPAGPDGLVGTLDDDLRLSMGSPCLDIGNNRAIPPSMETDLDGKSRIANERVDLGAYEFNGPFCYYVDAATGNDLNGGWSPREAFATIQKGINVAREGYTVWVAPGVYRESIDFRGKGITVAGLNGAPTIESPDEYAVSFYSAEGPDSVLKNFVILHSDVGIFIAGSSPTIRNVTIAGNDFGIAAYAGARPVITNCILWDNRNGDLFGCTAQFSCIQQGLEGRGNIRENPLFADTAAGDYHLMSEKGRYVAAYGLWAFDNQTSPCIDAGNPEDDVSAERMPNGARIDMGAFGGTPQASLSRWPLAGDLDQDGVVDFKDLAILAETWLCRLQTTPP
ncbi:MAG TPA: right-handed parallel beta-helix repeat-containing protein [Sedimentisphaerales bacterium]|nr:right-handed parallel beta-helix repeat-containing protein [Sedimentisphaerales bacterium]